MQRQKIIVALAIALVLGITVTGLAYAQLVAPPQNTYYSTQPDDGFLGWIGGCVRGYGPYYYQYQAPQSDGTQQGQVPQQTSETPPPYVQPQYPNQGSYQYGYERGYWGW